ncbi:MAG: 5-oxoprolinase subunit PxpB [Winogradskyella sp.]|uniref:5-oxoprolinase subunit PxpB n=1 Tax=Winogradskyella sp. TaxID=1883156 RepID=UPI0025D7DE34|nr:5-oxoprolinase subunit PxpB [Winogradskyella sp.]NRB59134.1 5-oxoprolinase subunit PxpB [Winogradskyella sp.]
MSYNLRYFQYNERSILIEWPSVIDENILNDILKFKHLIENKYIKQKVEVISSYASLLIIYTSTIDKFNDTVLSLKELYVTINATETIKSQLWEIPVCYDDEFATDLDDFSKQKSLSKSQIIELHSSAIYTVYFTGFLPGFLYLGGLDEQLFLDRKKTPSLDVKKGAVAIGGKQTGIYPQNSPGGWHVIGNTPVSLFSPKANSPCFIKSGDRVKFIPVDRSEYNNIKQAVEASDYKLRPKV